MKNAILTILTMLFGFQLSAQFEDLGFGTDSTLDVVSWNIEHFPKNGQITVDYVVEIIEALDADVVAIQEMSNLGAFQMLIDALDGWEGYFAPNPYVALVILYKTEVIHDPEFSIILADYDREFPREPLVMEMQFLEETYVIINNHFKCCGDGYLDLSDDWDEEKRRLDASNLIDQYIYDNYPEKKVFVVGDLNDILTDSPSNNVFQVFIDEPDNYEFVDMGIAEGSSTDWSYPSWPSHIDHILITDELFDAFQDDGSEVQTIKVDEYFESFYEYDEYVSDHRPVGIKINTSDHVGVHDLAISKNSMTVFPNPTVSTTNIIFDAVPANAEIVLLNTMNQIVHTLQLSKGQTSVSWNIESFPLGIYVAILRKGSKTIAQQKIIRLQ